MYAPQGMYAGAAAGTTVDAVLAGAGLTASSGVLAVGAGNGISVAADAVSVDQSYAFAWTAAHSHTISDAGTTSVVYPQTFTHRTSGTAAAGFGVGVKYAGEDASDNAEDIAAVEAIWTTATNASEASAWLVKTRKAGGALTEDFRVTPGKAKITARAAGDGLDIVGAASGNVSPAMNIYVDATLKGQFGAPVFAGHLATNALTTDFVVAAAASHALLLGANAAGHWRIATGGALEQVTAGHIELKETSTPSAAPANGGRLYLDDSGGKTRLMVIFQSGAAQQIAIEP